MYKHSDSQHHMWSNCCLKLNLPEFQEKQRKKKLVALQCRFCLLGFLIVIMIQVLDSHHTNVSKFLKSLFICCCTYTYTDATSEVKLANTMAVKTAVPSVITLFFKMFTHVK